MSSDAGQSVDRAVTAHRQGLKRGAGTSTVPNSEFNLRVRVSPAVRTAAAQRAILCDPGLNQMSLHARRQSITVIQCQAKRIEHRSESARLTARLARHPRWGLAPPPRATSWLCFVPLAPFSSIVTRHSIPAPGLPGGQR
jgi:hypothetical protein